GVDWVVGEARPLVEDEVETRPGERRYSEKEHGAEDSPTIQPLQCRDPAGPDREAPDDGEQQARVVGRERDAERWNLEQRRMHAPALAALAQVALQRALRTADVAGHARVARGEPAHPCSSTAVPGRAGIVIVARAVQGLELADRAAAVSIDRVAVVTLL